LLFATQAFQLKNLRRCKETPPNGHNTFATQANTPKNLRRGKEGSARQEIFYRGTDFFD
jgi:hypothetical protein